MWEWRHVGFFKIRYFTWLCLPSTTQRPVANTQVVQGSYCSWWRTLALLTWEGELDGKKKERDKKMKCKVSGSLFPRKRSVRNCNASICCEIKWSAVSATPSILWLLLSRIVCISMLWKHSVPSVYPPPTPPPLTTTKNTHTICHTHAWWSLSRSEDKPRHVSKRYHLTNDYPDPKCGRPALKKGNVAVSRHFWALSVNNYETCFLLLSQKSSHLSVQIAFNSRKAD